MSAPTSEKVGQPVKGEWRHGWWWYSAAGCDWTHWIITLPLPDLTIQPRKEYGLYWAFGPLYAWVTLERGSEWFENGKRAGLGIGPA